MVVSASEEVVISAGQKRLVRARAAALLSALEAKEGEILEPLSWQQLLLVPDWCFWDESRRERLTLIAGALFVAPAMRLWIDADRLRQARELLGEPVFNTIVASKAIPKESVQVSQEEQLEDVFFSAGLAVLLSSLDPALRPRLTQLLNRRAAGMMPQHVAVLLANEAVLILQEVLETKRAADESGEEE